VVDRLLAHFKFVDTLSDMLAALMGYRGCGKTTIGKRLADRLWARFVDIDDLIIRAAGGKSIRDIFLEHGEPYYRDIETECLREALKQSDIILALGGGSVIRDENRAMLAADGGKIIYLKCDPEELDRRIKSDPSSALHRPSLTSLGGGIQEIRIKLSEREPLYREVMHVELDVTNLSPEEAVHYVARLM
jgi:shikimate kinase